MQRTFTIIGIIILFAIGVYFLAGGFTFGLRTYVPPSDPTLAAVLVGSLAGIVVLIVAAGGALSFVFKQLGGTLEKEKPGAPSGPKADANVMAPYTPPYSYKSAPEKSEIRQWMNGTVIMLAIWVGFAALTNYSRWVKAAQELDPMQWAIAGAAAVAIVIGIVAVGAGLGFWFYRTHEEQMKAAKK